MACRRRQKARELSCDLGCDVAHGGQHGDPAVLQLHGAAAPKGSDVTVGREAQRIPKASGKQTVVMIQLSSFGYRRRDCPELDRTPSLGTCRTPSLHAVNMAPMLVQLLAFGKAVEQTRHD